MGTDSSDGLRNLLKTCVTMDARLNRSRHHAFLMNKADHMLGCFVLVSLSLDFCVQFWNLPFQDGC